MKDFGILLGTTLRPLNILKIPLEYCRHKN